MEIGNQAQDLMGVSGEERQLKCCAHESSSHFGCDLEGLKMDIVDVVIGEVPSSLLGLGQQETQGSDTYCLGPLLRSPRSTSILPEKVSFEGNLMGQ